jgi:anti-anti-sigma regulatory factor
MFDNDHGCLDDTASLVRAGIAARHKVLCLTQAVMPVAVAAALESIDVATGPALDRGQLRIATGAETYLRHGGFDPDTALSAWRQGIEQARREGYHGLLVIADMMWAARPVLGPDRLAWYEARLSRLCADGFVTAVCMYDRRVFTGAELQEISKAHLATASPGYHGNFTVRLRIARTTDPAVIRLTGEADLATRFAVQAVLDGALDDLPYGEPATVDLAGLRFADAATAAALVRLARALPPGSRFVGTSAPVAGLLNLVGDGMVPGLDGDGTVLEGVA